MNKLHLGRFLSLGCFSDTEGWITQNVLQMDEKTGTKHVPDSASVADLISLKYKKLVYFITPLFTPEVQYPIIHLVLFSFEFSINHLSLNRISLLVLTGAQCSRKKEKTKMLLSNPSHVFISPLSHAVASSGWDKPVDSWFEEGKKTWLSLLSSVITHCLLLYHCSNLTCCCYYL